MTAHNLAALEQDMLDSGWSVDAHGFVSPQRIPGQVNEGGYHVTLRSPTGDEFVGDGPTRPDALRTAAKQASLLRDDGLSLM